MKADSMEDARVISESPTAADVPEQQDFIDPERRERMEKYANRKIKTRQVEAFYQLLVKLGLHKVVQKGIELRRKKDEGAPKVTAASQRGKGIDDAEVVLRYMEMQNAINETINMGELLEKFAEAGCIATLVSIVMDCTPEEAMEIDIEDWEDAFTPFVMKSMRLITSVTGTVGSMA